VDGLKRIAPAFPVSDAPPHFAHYRRLGFSTREYTGVVGWLREPAIVYGFAVMDDVEIHVGIVPEGEVTASATAYLYVDEADSLARAWAAAGIDVGGFLEDTEWGQREGVGCDLDRNTLRFGSLLTT